MMKAVGDKVIVELMKPATKSGLVLPDTVREPQAFGKVLSVGEEITDKVKEGMHLVFHPSAGMDMLLNKEFLKVIKYEELYAIVEDDELIGTLEKLVFGAPTEQSKIIKAAPSIIT